MKNVSDFFMRSVFMSFAHRLLEQCLPLRLGSFSEQHEVCVEFDHSAITTIKHSRMQRTVP